MSAVPSTSSRIDVRSGELGVKYGPSVCASVGSSSSSAHASVGWSVGSVPSFAAVASAPDQTGMGTMPPAQAVDSTTALTPDALQGPPTPAVAYAVVGMTDAQLARYLAAYRAHMDATRETRWNFLTTLRMLDRATQAANLDAMRSYELRLQQLWPLIRDRDDSFDEGLAGILQRNQYRRYRVWKDAWRRGTRVQRQLDAESALAGHVARGDL